MSEAELHLIRARLDGGLRNKAKRGELRLRLPVGLDRDEDDRIVLCADEQVRHAIERVFCLWRQLGSARQVVIELIDEGQKLPRRTVGQRRIRWARASYGAVHDFLTNPAYAGAFVFGRPPARSTSTRTAGCASAESKCRSRSGPSACPITIPAMSPGMSTSRPERAARERETTRRRRRRRRARATRCCKAWSAAGAADDGCRSPTPGTGGNVPRYLCSRRARSCITPATPARSLGGARLDKAVAAAFLEAVTPGRRRRDRRRDPRARGPARAAARRPATRARARRVRGTARRASVRRVRAGEPARRPHAGAQARGSARRGRARARKLIAAIERARPVPLTDAERDALGQIARDLPRLWDARTTTRPRPQGAAAHADQRGRRHRRPRPARHADVEIFWEGGARTELQLRAQPLSRTATGIPARTRSS